MTRLVAFALVLIVALTSQQLALARGRGLAAGEMVICSGGGFMSVAVDARGKPVGPAHICPDGLQGFAATDDAATVPDAWLPAFEPVFLSVIRAAAPRALLPLRVSARAPPVAV